MASVRTRKSLFGLIFSSHLAILLLAMVILSGYMLRELRAFDLQQTMNELEARSRLFYGAMAAQNASEKLNDLCRDLGAQTGTRLTVISPDGVVLADSEKDPAGMENHSNREEVRTATNGQVGKAIRFSGAVGQDMLYVAVPLPAGAPKVIVRAATSLRAFEAALAGSSHKITLVAVALAAAAVLLSFMVSRRIATPLEELRRGVDRLSRGESFSKLPLPKTAEPAVLAAAINRMAEELQLRFNDVARRHNELQAVLRSMSGGVLAVDLEERIVFTNDAAERMFGRKNQEIKGRFVQEVIRHVGLCDFLRLAAQSEESLETDVALHGLSLQGKALGDAEERYYQVRSAPLIDAAGKRDGVLAVLNDVTTLYRLEQVRRDFVANASHELKTPITAIRGFAETLHDDDAIEPEQRRHFLDIILRQTGRLQTLIEDLLMLSRLENSSSAAAVPLAAAPILPVLFAAIQTCEHQAASKNIAVSLVCDEELQAEHNPELLERAVVNLVDNAIKYSSEGATVTVAASQDNGVVRVAIMDQGPGIPKEHRERIFERFYRVDKARSRQLGGTGLGLAIVKHIMLLHRGQLTLESGPGVGSVFTLALRAAREVEEGASATATARYI